MISGDEEGLPRWQIMEEWLDNWQEENNHAPFSCHDLAASLEIPTREATWLIQAYLNEQCRPRSESDFVLKRQGRTRAAVWSVGLRNKDVNQINQTFYDDMIVKSKRAFEPSLERIATLSPQRARRIRRQIDGTLEGAFRVMASALEL